MKSLLSFVLLTAISTCHGSAGFLPQNLVLDDTITPPEEYLGFQPGERHMLHHQLLGYMQLLAGQSGRMEWTSYGETHGHRTLGQLIISSPENLARLESIRQEHLLLADPGKSGQLDTAAMPIVVNLNYSVHGNEASGANAAPIVAYYLAAAKGSEMDDLLDNMIILLDPVLNPDGLDRFANWTNDYAGKVPSPDPNDREHTEGWPNGRTNYYWFDLNRDWMLLTQPESRSRIQQYHRWLPNFVLDFHEMGTDSTYFFQPGVPERSHPLIPDNVYALTEKVSLYFADALDQKQSLYFTKERFDDFYMGKGSTISDLKGAIGILFEQASARGVIQDSVNGPVTFAFAIGNQVDVSLAVLKGAHELRREFLQHTRQFFTDSLKEAEKQNFAGYRFSSVEDPARADLFAGILRQHEIGVYRIRDEEAWYVPVAQPHYRYLEALVEQRREFEESIFYDITAWTLPMAYNLEWEQVKKAPAEAVETPLPSSLSESRLGYVFGWDDLNAPGVLFDLLQEGVMAKVATAPFTMDGREFGYGSVFIPLRQQADKAGTVFAILRDAVASGHVEAAPVQSYLTGSGIDLGSNSFATVDVPRVILATGRGVDAYTSGSVWHLLDVYHDFPVTMVEPSQFGSIDLDAYTAIILPGGSSSAYSPAVVARLKDWIRQGGTLICLGNSPGWAIENELSTSSLVKDGEEDSRERRPFSAASDDKALQDIKGAIFMTEVDISHPLAYGITGDRLPVFLESTTFLAQSKNPYQTPLLYAEDPLVAGYASEENLDILGGSAAVVVEPSGKGSIILFAHHPTFRGYWRGTEKLLLNAILFGGIMNP